MRHLVKGRKLKRTSSHRKALLRNLATSLFEHKRLITTEAKAKELRPVAESLITKAKHALAREKQGLLPTGQTIDVHNRRQVGRFVMTKAVVQELFDAIAPVVENRNGGYTRIVKLGTRRGDAGKMAVIELVDWANPKDGADSLRKKKKAVKKVAPKAAAPAPTVSAPEAKPVEEAPAAEPVSEASAPEVETETKGIEVVEDDSSFEIKDKSEEENA